jgi:hypothetical protein
MTKIMKKILKMIRHNRLMIFTVFFYTLTSCAPKLTYTEIEEKINARYTAFHEGDIEYMLENLPKKGLQEYGEDGYRKKLLKVFNGKRKNIPQFNEIGDLRIQEINKCNSTYFYKVKYLVDKAEYTPYLDSTALELNYKEYGKDNVNFLSNAKILQTRLKEEEILIFDKGKKWILLDYDSNMEYLDRYYGDGFSECIKVKVDSSNYLPYM